MKVLIADDDPTIRMLVGEYLAAFGHETQLTECGTECLHYLESNYPDLLILDMIMPDMNGMEVLSIIRSNPALAKLPVILLSADTNTATAAASDHTKADIYMQKPFAMKDILGAVSSLDPSNKPQ